MRNQLLKELTPRGILFLIETFFLVFAFWSAIYLSNRLSISLSTLWIYKYAFLVNAIIGIIGMFAFHTFSGIVRFSGILINFQGLFSRQSDIPRSINHNMALPLLAFVEVSGNLKNLPYENPETGK